MNFLTVLALSGFAILLLNVPSGGAGTTGGSAFQKSDKCGKPQVAPSRGFRIVGGGYVQNNSWPWACAMVQEVQRQGKPTYRQFCDCTLIDNEWVMTAAHCTESLTRAQFLYYVKIYVGVENLNRAVREPRFRYDVSDLIKHERFVMKTKDYDIALVKLARPIDQIDNDTLPACLPNHHVIAAPNGSYEQTGSKGRKLCYIGGWGHTYEGQKGKQGYVGSGSDLLKQTSTEIYSKDDCKRTKLPTTDRMFCAGFDQGKHDTCQGDSGGPLVCDDGNGTWVVHGIVSWGAGCARAGAPGVYTNVWAMKPWIQNKTGIIFDHSNQDAVHEENA